MGLVFGVVGWSSAASASASPPGRREVCRASDAGVGGVRVGGVGGEE